MTNSAGATNRELESLAASLDRRFRTVLTPVDVGGRRLEIVHPASAEDLIDERDFERDERLPYWAELWPSSQVLGERLLGAVGDGKTLLELGCGSGIVATCASLAGFAVTATDYYDDALHFAKVNAWRNGAKAPTTFALDWRALPEERQAYDVVVASDVLYERPYAVIVAKTIDAYLAADGYALVADPGRVARAEFIRSAGLLGMTISDRADIAFAIGPIRQTISILEIRRIDATFLSDRQHKKVLRL